MRIKKPLKESNHHDYFDQVKEKISNADRVIIGAGAGLSAAAGLDYNDPNFFKAKYQSFYKKGIHSVADAIARYWYLTEDNATTYWGFWSHHINEIYHFPGQLDTYKALYNLVKEKEYFIITTNVDDQFLRGQFDKTKIFSMQGSYGKLQCSKACHNEVYDNKELIKAMLLGFDEESLEIRLEDIPRCPVCGELLCPNLRIDHSFVEADSLKNRDEYVNFFNQVNEDILLLELGVGYNTPAIIKYPFDDMTKAYDHISMIRVNLQLLKSSYDQENDILMVDDDLNELITRLTM